MTQDNLRAVILTALPVEYKAARKFISNNQLVRNPLGNVYEQGIFLANNRIWEIAIAETGTEDSSVALQTTQAIEFFKPEVIILVGIAGGIRDVDIGDVVASTKIYSYESSKAEETFKPRPTIGLGSFALSEAAKAEGRSEDPAWLRRLADCPNPPPKAWVGPIIAGEKIVASTKSSLYQFLRQNYSDALAVEMEGYGFFQAMKECQQPVSAIVVRGISDLIDNIYDDQIQEPETVRQEKAARHASAFAFQLLADFNSNNGITIVPLPGTVPQIVPIGGLPTSGQLSVQRQRRTSNCFIEPEINLYLMLIPGGTFLMGSPSDELDRYNNESPQHEVTVSTFLMGRYPITQDQWRYIAAQPRINRDLDSDPSGFKGTTRPVEQVSWEEAVEFCDRISQLTGRSYRLPTEAEWEYACRAGTITPFHFGETITTDLANYCGTDDESEGWSGSYGNGPKGIYREQTTPVEQFQVSNVFGLCGMHGNVWEWCLDHWHDNYEEAPTDSSAWVTGGKHARRVLRGGSWYSYPRNCRSACRYHFTLDSHAFDIGFRVICEV